MDGLTNKCNVVKIYVDERNSESSVLVKCGNCGPFLIFDSHDVRPQEGDNCVLKIEYLGEKQPLVVKAKKKKVLIKNVRWENNQIIPKIIEAQGEIIKIVRKGKNFAEVYVDLGGIYIFATIRQKKVKIGDYLKFWNVDFGSIEK